MKADLVYEVSPLLHVHARADDCACPCGFCLRGEHGRCEYKCGRNVLATSRDAPPSFEVEKG